MAQGAGDDILFGDFGKLYPTLGANAAPGSLYFNNFFFSIDTSAAAKAAANIIFGNGGGDVLLGGQGDDLLSGGEGDDDLIGGHNISGSLGTPFGETAVDELEPLDAAGLAALKAEISLVAGNVTDVTVSLANLDPTVIHPLNNTMLGGEGDDVLVGDNGIVACARARTC